MSARPTSPRIARTSSVTSRKFRARVRADRFSLWWEKRATWTFSKTDILGKMFVIWKDLPIPFRMTR